MTTTPADESQEGSKLPPISDVTTVMSEIQEVDPESLTLNPEYKKMYGASPEIDKNLRDSMIAEGQQIPIVANQNRVIIDGHRRWRICKELGIPVSVEFRHFADSSEEKRFIHISNLDRRHLTSFARIVAVFKEEDWIKQEAHKRQLSGLKHGKEAPSVQNTTDGEEHGRADQICADKAFVPLDTYRKVTALLRETRFLAKPSLNLLAMKKRSRIFNAGFQERKIKSLNFEDFLVRSTPFPTMSNSFVGHLRTSTKV